MLEDVRYYDSTKLNPSRIVILLHGLGADNRDLISLAPEFSRFVPKTLFTSVNAPYRYEFSSVGYQWFSLKNWDESRIFEEIERSSIYLKEYLENISLEFDIPYKKIFLVGFSQGAMMSLHTGLRIDQELAGIISLSGKLVKPEKLRQEIKVYPRVMLNHGTADQVVPYILMDEAKETMESLGVPVEAYTSMYGHGIDESCIKRIITFLNKG